LIDYRAVLARAYQRPQGALGKKGIKTLKMTMTTTREMTWDGLCLLIGVDRPERFYKGWCTGYSDGQTDFWNVIAVDAEN